MGKHFGIVKTKKQIADEYGVCWKTFNNWLKKNNIVIDRGLITPKDQLKIYDKLGIPMNSNKFN
jgi:hypothetical protein